MSYDLNDADQLKRILIDPVVDAVRTELQSLVAKTNKAEADITALQADMTKVKSNQSKAMAVYGLLAIVAGSLYASVKGWVLAKLAGLFK